MKRQTFVSASLGALFAASSRIAAADDATAIRIACTPATATSEAYITDQLGYFKKAGLNVTVTQIAQNPLILDAVVTGSQDIGVATPLTVGNAILHGLPLRAIGTGMLYTESQTALCVAKDSPITNAQGLQGAVVGVAVMNEIQSLGVLSYLDKYHVDKQSVHFIEAPMQSMAGALKRGAIQAAVIGEPFITASRDDIRIIPRAFDALGNEFGFHVWYTRSDFAKKNSAALTTMMQQVYAAAKLCNTKPAAVESLMGAWSKLTPEVEHRVAQPVFATEMTEQQFKKILELATGYKLFPRPLTYRELTTN